MNLFPSQAPKTKWNRDVFLKWESLRVLYCMILAVVYFNGLRPVWHRMSVHSWMDLAVGALILNLLFLTGPLLEHVMLKKGWDTGLIRCFLFAGGTMMSVFLVFLHTAGLQEIMIGVD